MSRYTGKMEVQSSVSKVLSQVSQSVSQCCAFISSSDEDPNPHLSDVSLVLSEISGFVKVIADKQQQQQSDAFQQQHEELWWDPSDVTMLSNSTQSSSSCSNMSSDVLEDVNVGDLFVQEHSFLAKMTSAIDRFAPNNAFSRTKHERKMKKKLLRMIPRELHCLWRNVDSVTGVAPAVFPVKSAPALKVNWSNVNTRALANVPKPKLYPKHGCAEDPSHYQPYTTTGYSSDGEPKTIHHKSKFEEDNPFGSAYGVETDAGVLSVSGILIHGHTWSEERGIWLLHASYQSDGGGRDDSRDRDNKRSRDRCRRDRDRRTCG